MNRKSRNWTLYLALFLVGASAIIIVEGFSRGNSTACRTGQGGRVIVTVSDNQGFQPKRVNAKQCDTLVIQNKTKDYIEVAFGEHDRHIPYPGFTQEVLASTGELSIVLTERGQYLVHDHLNDDHYAQLTIE